MFTANLKKTQSSSTNFVADYQNKTNKTGDAQVSNAIIQWRNPETKDCSLQDGFVKL